MSDVTLRVSGHDCTAILMIGQSEPCHNESVHGSCVPDGTSYGGVSCNHANAVVESQLPLHLDGACVTVNRYDGWVDSIEHANACSTECEP